MDKKDIQNRDDIQLLITRFYEKVTTDTTIGYIFTDVMKVNWELHLPVMYDFWEGIILNARKYHGNPMEIHQRLNKVVPLDSEKFSVWLGLFTSTVDELYSCEKAELAKQRAASIATMMQIKILEQQ